jgi:hypothetical protein
VAQLLSHLRLRHRLAIGYFSGDVIFVAFTKRYPEAVKRPEQVPYFWGAALSNWLGWQIPSIAGIYLANVIPLSWGLGFAGVLALLGVLYSMLNDRATWVACAVASLAAVAAFALPLKLNILTAIAAAVSVGLLMEQAERRAVRLRPLPAVRPPDPAKGEHHPVLPLDEGTHRICTVACRCSQPGRECGGQQGACMSGGEHWIWGYVASLGLAVITWSRGPSSWCPSASCPCPNGSSAACATRRWRRWPRWWRRRS